MAGGSAGLVGELVETDRGFVEDRVVGDVRAKRMVGAEAEVLFGERKLALGLMREADEIAEVVG